MTPKRRKTLVTAALLLASGALAHAQVPNPVPALAAARDARAKTEVAQKKNSEALDQEAKPPASTPPPAGGSPPPAAGTAAPPPPSGAGYTYDPNGRRDPFVSLTARGADLPAANGARPAGVPGLLISEVTLKGVFKSKSGFIALVQSPDNRTYIVRAGDKVFDGSVRAVTQEAVVFSQDVNDPLSTVKQREVRKSIRPEAR